MRVVLRYHFERQCYYSMRDLSTSNHPLTVLVCPFWYHLAHFHIFVARPLVEKTMLFSNDDVRYGTGCLDFCSFRFGVVTCGMPGIATGVVNLRSA